MEATLEAPAPKALPEPSPPQAQAGSGPRVWAVGGGKGGVGKSVVTAALAMSLAQRGRRCVVVDADLGAANLHTLLGLRSPALTLSHFLSGEVTKLSDLLCGTPHRNLWLVSGSRALLEMANPHRARKDKLLRHLRALPADEVLLDLSAGSAFNVLDFFLAAERGLLVVTPEPTSVENAYHFLKAAFYRSLRPATKRPAVRRALQAALAEHRAALRSPRALLAAVAERDAEAGRVLALQAQSFAPALLLNQATNVQHREIGRRMRDACREQLGARVGFLGVLERDECVRAAVREGRPVLERFPGCAFARGVDVLTGRLLEGALEPEQATSAFPVRRLRVGDHDGLATAVETAPASVPDAPLPPLDLDAPGVSLRQRREALGLALAALEARTRIRHLAELEAERFDRLPPEPYLRGQVIAYARALGIAEAEALADRFRERARSTGC